VPSCVRNVFAGADVEPAGAVHWGEPIPSPAAAETGVYVVSLSENPDSLDEALAACPIMRSAVEELLGVCPGLTLDGEPTTAVALTRRLSAFWLPDEVVLYIGLAGQPLRNRVGQYYNTPLGARRPHKGGWWLKTLSVLPKLWVHYAPTAQFAGAEQDAMAVFADGVSTDAGSSLHDSERVMPFANLEFPPGTRKRHGIRGATVGDAPAPPAMPERTSPTTTPSTPAAPALASAGSGTGRTQRVTAKDIEAGRIRIPQDGTKRLFPREKQNVEVSLRGNAVTARWDPKYGPDRERSGVIAVGRGQLAGIVEPDEVLRVTATRGHVRLE
jgi:hypothetical protein